MSRYDIALGKPPAKKPEFPTHLPSNDMAQLDKALDVTWASLLNNSSISGFNTEDEAEHMKRNLMRALGIPQNMMDGWYNEK